MKRPGGSLKMAGEQFDDQGPPGTSETLTESGGCFIDLAIDMPLALIQHLAKSLTIHCFSEFSFLERST